MILQRELARQRIAQTAQRMRSMVYPQTATVDSIHLAGPTGRIGWKEAQELDYRPAELGAAFGPAWSTWWCRVETAVPADWAGSRVDLLWLSDTEATLWLDGQPAGGLMAVGRGGLPVREAVLTPHARPGERLEFVVEIACNVFPSEESYADHLLTGLDFALGAHDTPAAAAAGAFIPEYHGSLKRCSLARFDQDAWDLAVDFGLLAELEAEHQHGLDPAWAGTLLRELNHCCNVWRADDRATWPEARAILRPLLASRNGSIVHTVTALGHAHLDTAWLWPIEETRRKLVRGVASQLFLLERYPEYRFACSSAVHYAWLKADHPSLFERIRGFAAEGRWLAVGGSWVEFDCNVPSGESLVRQLVAGQRFFESELGARCTEFWNPDAFGFNAQLPQLLRGVGIEHFVTQKLSWNTFTKPSHDTFLWEGLDGSRVLTHFLPLATYAATATVRELRDSVERYQDHDVVPHSLLLFGYGDGGAGPTAEMVERIRRANDLQGLPRTVMRAPEEFFRDCESAADIPVFVGELYLERHRGTYTTAARLKRANRYCETLLHDLEFLAVVAERLDVRGYSGDDIGRLWKDLLVHQFHDVLPGTSIREVNEGAEQSLERIASAAANAREDLLEALAAGNDRSVPLNTIGFRRRAVAALRNGELALVDCPGYGSGSIESTVDAVYVRETDGHIVVGNAQLEATLRRDGACVHLVEKETGRDALSGHGNRIELWHDQPVGWDAWEIDPAHLESAPEIASGRLVGIEVDPLRADLRYEYRLGEASRIRQKVRLEAESRRLEFHAEVDWHERHRLLKVCFPAAVRAHRAVYQMQFGVYERPTDRSTPTAAAQFEVPGHGFVDLSDHTFGLALLSDCKYGYSVHEEELRVSLLRSPARPDPASDRGRHSFAYAVVAHRGAWQDARIVAEAAGFNRPFLWTGTATRIPELVNSTDENVVVDTIKPADDGNGIVLRLYEAHGASGSARIETSVDVASVWRCDLLEETISELCLDQGTITFDYRPFEIITLRLTVDDAPKR